MRRAIAPVLGAVLGAVLGLAVGVGEAAACACCTNQGQRHVGVVKLDSGKLQEISSLRFSSAAELFVGEGDVEGIEGIATPSATYEVHVAQEDTRWVLDLRDKAGHAGTLMLALPATISIFEVDPRLGEREGGQGPTLYKEWTLTAKAAGTGIFAAGARGARLALVLQGHGNSCTSSIDFSHWTLTVEGPKARYSLFGELIR